MSDEHIEQPKTPAQVAEAIRAMKNTRSFPFIRKAPETPKPYKAPFSLNTFIMRHRRALMTISLVADIALLVGVGVVCSKTYYAKGETAGIEIGHWHERERVGTQSLADSCNTLVNAYDMAPASEKIARHEPLKMDRTPCADIQKLATRMKH